MGLRRGRVGGSAHPLRKQSSHISSFLGRERTAVASPREDFLVRQQYVLGAEDIPRHVCRVYLAGLNSPQAPWTLPESPPAPLADVMLQDNWAAFAGMVTKRAQWSRSVAAWLSVFEILYPAAAVWLLMKMREEKARELCIAVGEFQESAPTHEMVWMSVRACATQTLSLKFGCDTKATLAYIDVVDHDRSLLDWRAAVISPTLVCCAGDGSYVAPFVVDARDPVTSEKRNIYAMLFCPGLAISSSFL